jgi:hypothetical protein
MTDMSLLMEEHVFELIFSVSDGATEKECKIPTPVS